MALPAVLLPIAEKAGQSIVEGQKERKEIRRIGKQKLAQSRIERRSSDVRGKLNLSPNLFNAIALVFVIAILPISLGVASSLATVDEYDYNDALVYGFNQNGVSPYLQTPDYADFFRTSQPNSPTNDFACGHIENSAEFIDASLPSWYVGSDDYWLNYHTWVYGLCNGDGSPSTQFFQDDGTRDILGSSDGVNTILQPQFWNVGECLDPNNFVIDCSIDSNYNGVYPSYTVETYNAQTTIAFLNDSSGTDFSQMVYVSSFKFTFTEYSNSYPCDDAMFRDDLTIEYNLQFLNFGNLTTIEFQEEDLSNSVFVGLDPNTFERMCRSQITLTPKFEYFEILSLIDEFTGQGWDNVTVIIDIDSILDSRLSTMNPLHSPFDGTDYYRISFEYSNYDDVEINSQLKNIYVFS